MKPTKVGIGVAALREFLEKRTNGMPKTKIEYCDRCDGCGWYEGGKSLQTECEKCGGSSLIDRLAKPAGEKS